MRDCSGGESTFSYFRPLSEIPWLVLDIEEQNYLHCFCLHDDFDKDGNGIQSHPNCK